MRRKRPLSPNGKKWLIFCGIVAAGMILVAVWQMYMHAPLDRLQEYEVFVEVKPDGTMEITYHYCWEVLNDSTEGPLSWVELGLANPECELVSYGGAISGLHYGYGNQTFWRSMIGFDLDREYYKGEVADFYFTVLQESMLCENKDDPSMPFYDFTPGWFEGMATEHYLFRWSGDPEIQQSNADRQEDGAHIWEGRLRRGKKRRMKVYYSMEAFEDPDLVEHTSNGGGILSGNSRDFGDVLLGIAAVIFCGYQIVWGKDNRYEKGRGYYGGGRRHRGGCACACAGCACACACAGGGRAGCSKKDFTVKL